MARQALNLYNILFTGRDPWDRNLDDATFFRPATKLGPDTRQMGFRPAGTLRGPLRRVWLARQLSGIGLPFSPPLWLLLVGAALVITDKAGTWALALPLYYWCALCLTAGVLFGRKGWLWWTRRHIRREVIQPTWIAISRELNLPRAVAQETHRVQISRTFEKPGDKAPARIYLPAGTALEGATRKRVQDVASLMLGMGDTRMTANLRGSNPYIELEPAPRLPDLVPFRKYRELMESLPAHTPLLGMGVGDQPMMWDLKDDAAHWLISGAPGGGKSTQARNGIMHFAFHKWAVGICDRKGWSYPEFRDTPGIHYAISLDAIADLWLKAEAELNRRINLSTREELDRQVKVFLLIDEAQTLIRALQFKWFTEGGFRAHPAITALFNIITMGREMGIHIGWVGQRVSASTFGGNGNDMKECFSLVTLLRWKLPTWKMFSDGAPYIRPPAGPGGCAGIQRGEARPYRGLYATGEEAREYALSNGEPTNMLEVLGGSGILHPSPDDIRPELEPPKLPELATIAEMCAKGALPGPQIGKDALRKWLQRNLQPEGKKGGNENVYRTAPVIEWRAKFADDLPDVPSLGAKGFCYALYGHRQPGDAERLIYIGQSKNPYRRLEEHKEFAPFGDLITRMEIIWQGWPTPDELFAVEMKLIGQGWKGERPWANHEGNLSNPDRVPIPVQREERQLREPGWVPPDKGERYVPTSQWDAEWPVLERVS
jgi:hypothetical protein